MLQDVTRFLGTLIWQTWQVLTVPPAKRPFTRFYKEDYWEADLEHQARVPPDALRRDWRGNTEDPTPKDP